MVCVLVVTGTDVTVERICFVVMDVEVSGVAVVTDVSGTAVAVATQHTTAVIINVLAFCLPAKGIKPDYGMGSYKFVKLLSAVRGDTLNKNYRTNVLILPAHLSR